MNCQNKNIAIMGGTFNPIHIGHLAIAQEALEFKKLDRIIFMPAGTPPHKDREIVSSHKRFEMVKISTSNNDNFEISDFEINKKSRSYSFETVKYLKSLYGIEEIYFIMGEDSLMSIESWYKYKEFLSETKILVARRSYKNIELLREKIVELNLKGYNIEEIPTSFLDISSTNIRERFRNGQNPRYYLEYNTFRYIEKEGLYV
ncbi:nicotinate-nucleotide adenylyltransferase [Miniphocaeibacter massiliensis]|uniref:nicotinate-nucleotide adenylyltransferase n=1 Tax=Miniphocaeibacter massiliensis TaxID=2041841 RepID=UPI001F5D8D46|nr:nicotinate-nucleotide adenylyltransferase [Miniphocaeibacter massiliensis]